MARQPTEQEIRSSRYTRAQLAEWGVPWPPPKGWRKRLLKQAGVSKKGRRRNNSGPRRSAYAKGELHRCWPEWTWDGEKFVRT